MSFSNVKIIDPYVENGMTPKIQLTLSSIQEVESVEKSLNTSFPLGYKEYVTTLGKGEYCGFIRVDLPLTILEETKEHQQFLNEYYFWEDGEDIISKEKAIESIKIADTNHGDVIIFHPSKTDELFVLPHDSDVPYEIGKNLYEAIEWLCNETEGIGELHLKRYFMPFNPLWHSNGILTPKNI